jgi:hypothetical protein
MHARQVLHCWAESQSHNFYLLGKGGRKAKQIKPYLCCPLLTGPMGSGSQVSPFKPGSPQQGQKEQHCLCDLWPLTFWQEPSPPHSLVSTRYLWNSSSLSLKVVGIKEEIYTKYWSPFRAKSSKEILLFSFICSPTTTFLPQVVFTIKKILPKFYQLGQKSWSLFRRLRVCDLHEGELTGTQECLKMLQLTIVSDLPAPQSMWRLWGDLGGG